MKNYDVGHVPLRLPRAKQLLAGFRVVLGLLSTQRYLVGRIFEGGGHALPGTQRIITFQSRNEGSKCSSWQGGY